MKEKVSFMSSLGTRIRILTILVAIISGAFMMWTYAPEMKKEIITTSDNYLNDVCTAYGKWIGERISNGDKENALSQEFLTEYLAGVGIQGIDSSYIYVVDKQGTMLYHPTADKIGQPVENAVVKGIVADIEAGKAVKNGVITYEYKGAMKHAATYVNETQDFILIVTADEDEVLSDYKNLNRKGWIGMVCAIVLCTLIASWLVSLIIKPIYRILSAITVLSDMDFKDSADLSALAQNKDELGVMARALAVLREELVSVVETIRSSSTLLSQAAEELKSDAAVTTTTMKQVDHAVDDIAGGASSQAMETQRASENVMMIGDMVEDTSSEVDQVMEYSKQMQEANSNARNILKSLESINSRAEQHIDIIAQQTNETNSSAMKIGEATKIIAEIAEQTNLLSLNASIEAARAGEQGKGFAVVATEIQKLAEQSTASAKQIETILQMLLSDSEQAVETMQQVKSIIREQSEYMERTDAAFENMNQGVSQSIRGMEEIAKRTRNLDDARVNVVEVVNNLTSIAQQNAAATEETSTSLVSVTNTVSDISDKVQALHGIADELDNKMQVFQI